MKSPIIIAIFLLIAALFPLAANIYADEVIYDFEENTGGWIIPDWARDLADHISRNTELTGEAAKDGKSSLKLNADFPGEGWYASAIEVEGPFDWSKYNLLSCDIMIPESSPTKIVARFALIVGDDYLWIESTPPAVLVPGQWTTLSGTLEAGKEKWKRTKMVERIGEDGLIRGYVEKSVRIPMLDEYKSDIQAVVIRVEANWIKYKGPVYIDNVRLSE